MPVFVVSASHSLISYFSGQAVTAESLLAKIFELEDDVSEVQPTPKETSSTQSNLPEHDAQQSPKKSKKKKKKKEENKSVREEIRETEKEVEKYRSRMQCKVCLDAQVGTLFLPCRHLICCVECAKSVSKCPLCREHIIGTIKTFVGDLKTES